MRVNRLKEQTRDNASSYHKTVLDIVKEVLPNHVIYQEYPYSKILSDSYKRYKVPVDKQNSVYLKRGNRLFADIYIKGINTVIEVNGQQHYELVFRSKNEDAQKAVERFIRQKNNDDLKRQISVEAEVCLIEIPYSDIKKVDKNYIMERLWTEK